MKILFFASQCLAALKMGSMEVRDSIIVSVVCLITFSFKCNQALYHDPMYVYREMEEESSKVKQTTIKTKQHSTPKAVTFPKKNELPHVYTCGLFAAFLYVHTNIPCC